MNKLFFGKLFENIRTKFFNAIALYQKSQFASCGTNVTIGADCDFIPSHIHCGHHVHIGPHASFIASIAEIHIGNYVTFGPHVTIRGGNHRTDLIGKHIYEIGENEKLPGNDANVIIEDGVWVGCNVTILMGVTIGRGSVIGAGAVVTKDIPPYSIAVGNPAKVVKNRFSSEQIERHESELKRRNVM